MPTRFSDLISKAQVDKVLHRGDFGRRLPGIVFKSPDFLSLEFERWLSRTWLFVGRGADIPDPGDARTAPGLPIFLIRSETGHISAFHNACRHRGHRLISEPCKGLKQIICPYHRWTYRLDGQLRLTPNAGGARVHDLPGFDKTKHSLLPVRCESWHDWIFINLHGDAPPLTEFIAPLAKQLDFVDFDRLKHFLTMERRPIAANWKLCMENTMEPYHVPYVHSNSAAGQPLHLHYMIEADPVVGCGIDVPDSEYNNQPANQDASLTNLNMSARYLVRMPNFFLTTYAPDVVVDTMIVPDRLDPRKSWMEQAWYTTSGRVPTPDEVAAWTELEEQVILEDIEVMTQVQAGVESSVVDDGGVLTPAWEACISAFYKQLVTQLSTDERANSNE